MRKKGETLRFDFSIVSLNGLNCKKSPSSIIYNPLNISENQIKGFNKIFLLNHEKKFFSRPLSKIQLEEKKLILGEFLVKKKQRRKFKVEDFVLKFPETEKENSKKVKVNGYDCKK